VTDTPAPKPSDLKVRTFSAIVMVVVAGTALWLGGLWLDGLILIVAFVTFCELVSLVLKSFSRPLARAIGVAAGAAYVGLAARLLIQINSLSLLLLIFGTVVSIDVCAYFLGRTIGGPKIAPSISPSKTWAGLAGGILGAWGALGTYFLHGVQGQNFRVQFLLELLPFAALLAIIAQSGDFFESWLKRRAGVKDSSNLIPGHGGFFDRVDGLLPVAIAVGLVLVRIYPHWLNR
jgi:phosphatidate cytidylyltransferase